MILNLDMALSMRRTCACFGVHNTRPEDHFDHGIIYHDIYCSSFYQGSVLLRRYWGGGG